VGLFYIYFNTPLATCSVLKIMKGIKECDSYVKKEGVVSKNPMVSGCDNGVPRPIYFQGFVFLYLFCIMLLIV
jgi:hypothetical protein